MNWSAELARLGRLARKELRESLRDRRAVLTLVLMPPLLYPLLAIAFLQLQVFNADDKAPPTYVVGLPDEGTQRAFAFTLENAERALRRRYAPRGEKKSEPGQVPPEPAHIAPLPRLETKVVA